MTHPAPSLERLAEATLAVAKARAELLRQLRAALLRDDDKEALHCARVLTGIEEHDGERDCANPGVH